MVTRTQSLHSDGYVHLVARRNQGDTGGREKLRRRRWRPSEKLIQPFSASSHTDCDKKGHANLAWFFVRMGLRFLGPEGGFRMPNHPTLHQRSTHNAVLRALLDEPGLDQLVRQPAPGRKARGAVTWA